MEPSKGPEMQLDDLDFADDLALLSQTHRQMQTCLLAFKANTIDTKPARLGDMDGWGPGCLYYLDSVVRGRGEGDTEADIKERIGQARIAFLQLNNIWSFKEMTLIQIKIRIFNTNVKPATVWIIKRYGI